MPETTRRRVLSSYLLVLCLAALGACEPTATDPSGGDAITDPPVPTDPGPTDPGPTDPTGPTDPPGPTASFGSIEIVDSVPSMRLGDTAAVAVVVRDTAGEVMDVAASELTWTTSDASVLRASAGTMRGVGAGAAWLRVTGGGAADSVRTRVYRDSLGVAVTPYLVQSIQRLDGSVPIVAGREALLRVFVTTAAANAYRLDAVARFFEGGAEVYSLPLTMDSAGIPAAVDEADTLRSLSARIPGDVLRPGLELELELDPDSEFVLEARRYPADGRLALDVREVPPFDLHIVPVKRAGDFAPTIDDQWVSVNVGFAARQLPIGEARVDIGALYQTDLTMKTSDEWAQLFQEITLLRASEGSGAYYYAAFTIPGESPYTGQGALAGHVAIGGNFGGVLVHELGHNFGMLHTPCTGSDPGEEPDFPYPDGHIGAYGWDSSLNFIRSPDVFYDFLSACSPHWISDYSYERILAYRDTADAVAAARSTAPTRRSTLVVWGRVSRGRVVLDPALVLDLPPMPVRRGAYRATGRAADGAVLFSVRFEPTRLGSDGAAAFVLGVPADAAIRERLARIEVTGPEGRAELTTSARSDLAAIVDTRTGRLLAIDRDGRVELPSGESAYATRVVSRGVGSE